jgi:hypothetical protein
VLLPLVAEAGTSDEEITGGEEAFGIVVVVGANGLANKAERLLLALGLLPLLLSPPNEDEGVA